MDTPKILQIIPASPGWYAAYRLSTKVDGKEVYDKALTYNPVAVWALVEDEDGYRWVSGYAESSEGFINLEDEDSQFQGWFYKPIGANP